MMDSPIDDLPVILVVDDDPLNNELMEAYLVPDGWLVKKAQSGRQALQMVAAEPPDVILLDALMPDVNGFMVCQRLKNAVKTRMIPIIIVTALTALEDRVVGIEAGADAYLSKPVARIELVALTRSLLRVKRYADQLENASGVIQALGRAIEARDGYTEQHVVRVTTRALAMGARLQLSPFLMQVLQRGCYLHDVGKIGIPESILNKPGRLSAEEMGIIQHHPVIGVEICAPLQSRLMTNALSIVRHHHERIDGTGYPDGLTGEAIPLLARIASVSDAYDAMTSDRPYRKSMTPALALDILQAGAGTQWDSNLVTTFSQLDTADLTS